MTNFILSKKWRTPTVVVVCGGIVLSLALGTRHSFGLFLQPMSITHGWGREVFAFAIAIQNLIWGMAQPFTGALADKFGAGRVLFVGTLCYIAGLIGMSLSTTAVSLGFTTGFLIGLGLSGTSFGIVFGAVGRTVKPEQRSMALGIAGAIGSFGQFAMLPSTQALITKFGWSSALTILAAIIVLPAVLSIILAEPSENQNPVHRKQSIAEAVGEAFYHRGFWLLTIGFFVCGFQIVFIATHLPAYLADKKLSVDIAVTALALIGLCNVVGTYLFGYLGGKFSKKNILSIIYLIRGVAVIAFINLPISAWSVYAFSAVMGLLWLGTVPLTSGIVAQVFGVRYLSMLFGFVFFSHQLGGFFGVWLGGYLFDLTGSYQTIWTIMIGLSVLAALLNWPIDEREISRPDVTIKESTAQ